MEQVLTKKQRVGLWNHWNEAILAFEEALPDNIFRWKILVFALGGALVVGPLCLWFGVNHLLDDMKSTWAWVGVCIGVTLLCYAVRNYPLLGHFSRTSYTKHGMGSIVSSDGEKALIGMQLLYFWTGAVQYAFSLPNKKMWAPIDNRSIVAVYRVADASCGWKVEVLMIDGVHWWVCPSSDGSVTWDEDEATLVEEWVWRVCGKKARRTQERPQT